MIGRDLLGTLEHSEEFDQPQTGASVWPHQYCPQFCLRRTQVVAMQSCFFCKYADFHVTRQECLEIGTCHYPDVQIT